MTRVAGETHGQRHCRRNDINQWGAFSIHRARPEPGNNVLHSCACALLFSLGVRHADGKNADLGAFELQSCAPRAGAPSRHCAKQWLPAFPFHFQSEEHIVHKLGR